jgi:hypothetical protein
VDEIVNIIEGLGEKVDEPIIVQKVLRSLPLRFDSKVSSIEEMKDLEKLMKDDLHGILTSYEMRTKKEKLAHKEATFKASKKTKGHKLCDCFNHESDTEEAQFVRNLKRIYDKYKGKLPSYVLIVVE